MQVWDGISSARIEFGTALAQEVVHTTTPEGSFIDLDAQPSIATMIENQNTLSALITHLDTFQDTSTFKDTNTSKGRNTFKDTDTFNDTNTSSQIKILDNTSISKITYGPEMEKYDLREWPVLHFDEGIIAARLLVGADGPGSLVRKFAAIEARGWSYDRMGVVASLKCEPSWITPTAWQRFLTTGPIAHLPVKLFLLISYNIQIHVYLF
jgi:ubiquinone biosynthesis monooxygenase Coq6